MKGLFSVFKSIVWNFVFSDFSYFDSVVFSLTLLGKKLAAVFLAAC